jgi:hypothetical protein
MSNECGRQNVLNKAVNIDRFNRAERMFRKRLWFCRSNVVANLPCACPVLLLPAAWQQRICRLGLWAACGARQRVACAALYVKGYRLSFTC